jgi:GT2 family glycosyltransferase
MKTIDIVMPTLRRIHAFKSLETLFYVPWPYKLHLVTDGISWADAVNIGIRQTNQKNDILLMDDDVILSEETLADVDRFYDKADIFGFQLLFPNQMVQHAGGAVAADRKVFHMGYRAPVGHEALEIPYYVCHVTTSLVYIKSEAINKLRGMAIDMPGISLEDVDFCFRAVKMGLRILYLPNKAIHLESATKKSIPNFNENLELAIQEIRKRHLQEDKFFNYVREFPKKVELPKEEAKT